MKKQSFNVKYLVFQVPVIIPGLLIYYCITHLPILSGIKQSPLHYACEFST